MDPVDLLLRAEAAQIGRARARRQLRHVHVEKAPLAVVTLQMAGEPHALWATLIGTSPKLEDAKLIIAPEPRNYDIEFAALAELGSVVCDTVDRFAKGDREKILRKDKPPRSRLKHVPQVLVPSSAAAEHLRRLARRMRPAGFGGKKLVPPVVNLGGAHLGFFADAPDEPGSSLLLVATRELSRHFITGQSELENAHLGTQLAWHDPLLLAEVCPDLITANQVKKLGGAEAGTLIESVPMGILTDPETDSETLVDLVTEFNRRRAKETGAAVVKAIADELRFEHHLKPVMLPIWRATWIAHRILLAMNPAPSVERRWEADRDSFTNHLEYVQKGGRFASVASIRRATRQLRSREEALEALTCSEVLEDPIAMAAALAQGEAIRGKVVEVDEDHYEQGKKRKVLRPLVTLALDVACPLPVGTELYWSERPKLGAEIEEMPTVVGGKTHVVLKVTEGMKGELPRKGAYAIFSMYQPSWMPDAPMPTKTPWTHEPGPDAASSDSLEIDDGPPLDELVGLERVPITESI